MTVVADLGDGLRLRMAPAADGRGPYATGGLQRGLLLCDGDADLAEEGVGFGVPVLKAGAHTVFPGRAHVSVCRDGPVLEIEVLYRLELVERLALPDGRPLTCPALYAAKDLLAALHRRLPPARAGLTATSSGLRRRFGWTTVYVAVAPVAEVPVVARVEEGSGRLELAARLDGLPRTVTEAALMCEVGARAFGRYEEPGGPALEGDAVGTWDRVGRPGARFVSRERGVAVTLAAAEGGSARRGRELVGARLAWAGFGLVAAPPRRPLSCTLTVRREAP